MSEEKLNDDAETVKEFCYLGNTLNSSGDFEMAVVAGTRVEWIRFRKCEGKVLYGRRFLLKIKEKVHKVCKRSALLYGIETWSFRQKEMELLRTVIAMIRTMYGVRLID